MHKFGNVSDIRCLISACKNYSRQSAICWEVNDEISKYGVRHFILIYGKEKARLYYL